VHGHSVSNSIYYTHNLVAGHYRQVGQLQITFDNMQIGVADAAGMNL
jgi:hypothetical protein